jgi:hypothetical protein
MNKRAIENLLDSKVICISIRLGHTIETCNKVESKPNKSLHTKTNVMFACILYVT